MGNTYSVHRFRKALLQFVGGRLGQLAARAVLVLALVRILPIADYGAYMLIVGTAELLLQVGSCGILPLAQRYLPQMLTTLPLAKLYSFVSFPGDRAAGGAHDHCRRTWPLLESSRAGIRTERRSRYREPAWPRGCSW